MSGISTMRAHSARCVGSPPRKLGAHPHTHLAQRQPPVPDGRIQPNVGDADQPQLLQFPACGRTPSMTSNTGAEATKLPAQPRVGAAA